MGSDSALEGHLRTAPVVHEMPLPGGGGHQLKRTLVLRGGVSVAAKAGNDEMSLRRANREVAGWLLAVELGAGETVPVTVLRELPFTEGTFVGSAQVMWPVFKDALRGRYNHANVPDERAWEIALIDSLTGNQDRSDDNWGLIDDKPHLPGLIDSGHAFEPAQTTNSPFCQRFRGTQLPGEHVARVQAFRDNSDTSRLHEYLTDAEMSTVLSRADEILRNQELVQMP